jgi:hypothetical protein
MIIYQHKKILEELEELEDEDFKSFAYKMVGAFLIISYDIFRRNLILNFLILLIATQLGTMVVVATSMAVVLTVKREATGNTGRGAHVTQELQPARAEHSAAAAHNQAQSLLR